VIRLDAATVLLQWAVGGLFFLWVTTRAREVGIGYGWLVRGTFILMALGAFAIGVWLDPVPVREVSALAVAGAASVALVVSVQRRKAGVAGQRELAERRSARVAAMTGIDRTPEAADRSVAEFPPVLDLVAPLLGIPGLIAAGIAAGDPALLSVLRTLVGAAFLGSITDGMPGGRSWRWCAGPPSSGRSRSHCCSGRWGWSRCSTAPSTTATAARSAGSGWPAR
jgi:hypothetical protein